jgi:putative chitinase
MFSVAQLAEIIRQDAEHANTAKVRAELWHAALLAAMDRYKINTRKRAVAFLAQIGLESAGLTRLEEGLNYSAQGLANTWPSRYAVGGSKGPKPYQPNALAKRLHRNPVAIANNVYADRMGNGPEALGNGWKHRGMGPKQLTGLDNHRRCGAALGIDLVNSPELLKQPVAGSLSACWFWAENSLSRFADTDDFTGLTKAINGGLIGLDDNDRRDKDTRVDYWVVAKTVIGA